jgi:MFS family permease
VPLQSRPKYDGLLGAIELAAQGFGPFLGGILVDKMSWRWCFYINLPCGGVSLLLLSIVLPQMGPLENINQPRNFLRVSRLDWIGLVLFTGSCVALLLVLQWGGALLPWYNARIISLLVLSSLLGITFVLWHVLRGQNTLLPVHLFKNAGVSFTAIFGFFAGSGLSIIDYYVSCIMSTLTFPLFHDVCIV